MVIERKDACNQNAGSLGRWGIQHPPKTTSRDSARPWKLLKGNREIISFSHWDTGGRSHRRPPLCAGLSTPRDLSLDATLLTQLVCGLTDGEAGEEIWSSVNCLIFVSISLIYGKNQQVRQRIAWSKDEKSELGLDLSKAWGGGWLKVSDMTR